jgi:hypothetical protein
MLRLPESTPIASCDRTSCRDWLPPRRRIGLRRAGRRPPTSCRRCGRSGRRSWRGWSFPPPPQTPPRPPPWRRVCRCWRSRRSRRASCRKSLREPRASNQDSATVALVVSGVETLSVGLLPQNRTRSAGPENMTSALIGQLHEGGSLVSPAIQGHVSQPVQMADDSVQPGAARPG